MDVRILILQDEEANLRRRGDYEGALRVLDTILAIDSSNSPALNNKAAILLMRRDYQEALPLLERAARADPTNGQAFNNLGLAFLNTGDPKGAARSLERALQLGYTHEGVRYNLGLAYFDLGMIDEALDEWQRVLRANPLNMQVLDVVYKLAQGVGSVVVGETAIDERILREIAERLKRYELDVIRTTDGEETLFIFCRK